MAETDLSPRLKFVNILPSAVVIATVIALLLSGAPQQAPTAEMLSRNAQDLGWTGLTLGTVGSLVAGLLLQPLELASIRFLEGYWSARGPLARLGRMGVWLQQRRKSRLAWQARRLQDGAPLREQAREDLTRMPDRRAVLPTMLGNRLRAAEERAGRPYRLDALRTWPRLYYVLSPETLQKLAEYRNQLDTMARFCIAFALAAPITAALLALHTWWLMVPLVFGVLSWLAYRSAVHAATTYGDAFSAAIDVYRLKLLTEMSVKAPENTDEERLLNQTLADLWERDDNDPFPPGVDYSSGSSP
ncbi:hypothetical protein ABT052_05700 [Streptomyces sp. NPDC002766]|uniref:hypothetical protein n=1 Tax=Streptomyces sp. NPDC002766 TaxID=3154429 RepID=UPI0033328A42